MTPLHPLSGRSVLRGFTLLEVLIALVILSFGLLGLAALQAYSVKTNQSAHFRSQATALANMMLDSLRANRPQLSQYYSNDYEAFACDDVPDTSTRPLNDIDIWRQQIACQLPSGRGAIAPISANEVAVCIRWTDARWETTAGSADGQCTVDATNLGAGIAGTGTGAGTDGDFSIFVVSTRF
ncbi:MAG: type IV pilus modification protein PilV [Xanthomonadales bacterium]|nr:type IV pilus modification protein PilV [Xanthomonadales bacterium]